MIALVTLCANALVALLIVSALFRARRERDAARVDARRAIEELEALRTLAREHFVIVPAASARDLLRVLDMHRPVGVSLRAVVDELQRHLEEHPYP